MIKKLISIILVLVMSVSAGITVSAASSEVLSHLGFMKEMTTRADSEFVRRDEFAAVAAFLGGLGSPAPTQTDFTDVGEDNIYSGSILALSQSKIMNGVGGSLFAPAETLTYTQALTVFIKLLGYNELAVAKGGYPGGYIMAAKSVGLYDELKVNTASTLDFGMLWQLTEALIETPVADFEYTQQNGQITENLSITGKSPLFGAVNLGIDVYEARVDSIDFSRYNVNVTITDSHVSAPLTSGDTAMLKCPADIDILNFDKSFVKIWVKDNDTLAHIEFSDGAELIYGTVYSVNGDTSETARYQVSKLDEIKLWDNDTVYETGEDFELTYNDKDFTGSLALGGNFVRMIVKDKKILNMETWDFTEGGIVESSTIKSILFTKGSTKRQIKDLESFEKVNFILDGEKRDIKDLKAGTVIDYFMNSSKTTLVILASERRSADILESVSGNDIEIGNLSYLMADTVYSSLDGGEYDEGLNDALYNTEVKVYFDGFSKVRYITNSGKISKNEFIGYLIGTNSGKGLKTDKEAYVTNLDDNEFVKKIYKFADNYDASEVSYSNLVSSSDLKNAKSIFRFELNGKEEIVKVSKLSPYFGYTEVDGLVSYSHSYQFPEKGNPMYFEIDGKRLYFDVSERIVAIYEKDGEVAFGVTNYRTLAARRPSSEMIFSFFGEYLSADFDLILLSGDMSTVGSDESKYGFISSLRTGLDADGDKVTIAEIDGKNYIVNPSDVSALKENMLVYYSTAFDGYADFDIDIKDSVWLEGKFFDWAGKKGANGDITLVMGTVKKIDSKRIYFDMGLDGNGKEIIEAYFFDRTGCNYRIYDERTGEFTQGSDKDELQGKDVIYILTSNGMVSNVFYIE